MAVFGTSLPAGMVPPVSGRAGTSERTSGKNILAMRFKNLQELKQIERKWKSSATGFRRTLKKFLEAEATRLQFLCFAYTPLDKGLLQTVRIDESEFGLLGEKNYNVNKVTITWVPDYAQVVHERNWGPGPGRTDSDSRPYRAGTQKKHDALGAPIGPRYAVRALDQYQTEWLKKKLPITRKIQTGFRFSRDGEMKVPPL